MEQLIAEIERAFAEVEAQLSDPDVFQDPQRAAELGRRHKELKIAADLAAEWRRLTAQAAEAAELIGDDDAEIRAMAEADRDEAAARLPVVEDEIRMAMLEKDPNDERSVIVEIRAGAGGDEAGIWAGDLFGMYSRFAEQRGFEVNTLEGQPNDVGGYREVFFELRGTGAYSMLKWESGVHRVQRVPATESQGRIHTSTATVVVRPEVEDVDVKLDMNDVKVDVYRSSGPGGQSVNTTDSAVRLTHEPTGIVVTCQNEKSQLQNKEQALKVLRARLYELEMEKQMAELSEQRKSAIGTGDRSEKIRTYNFQESRVTDHRIKLTTHNLQNVLGGELDDFIQALTDHDRRVRLDQISGGDAT